MREAERRSLFHSVHGRTNFSASIEHLCQDAKKRRRTSESLAEQDVQRELNSDCNLRDLNIIYNSMTTASKSNGEDKVELPGCGPEDWVKPGSCLAGVCGLEGHICGGLDCIKIMIALIT